MQEAIETVIIGGGQAGLSLSYYLQGAGREHIVLEKTDQPGDAWRNQRWDSFTLVTPNWTFLLPGAEYQGVDPDGFMPRAEIVNRFDHKFYRDGVTLLGHLRGVGDGELSFTPDLKENLVKVDKLEADILKLVDDYIARNQIPAPLDHLPVLVDGYSAPEIDQLDFKASSIATIIWAGGYIFDFSLVKLPVFDEYGFPLTDRGVSRFPGLFFLGMPWLHTQKSGLLMGVGEDAAYLAGKI